MRYYQHFLHDDRYGLEGTRLCVVFSEDKTNIPNKICQQETGKTGNCEDGACSYIY